MLYRGPDAAHVYVDGAVECVEFAAAHRFHDLVTRQHPARAFRQCLQQVELVRGEFAGLAGDADGARIVVDLQRAETQHFAQRRGARRMAAQNRADAGQQFAWLEGLGQIIVGADLQADDAVHRVALGGQHQHRYLGRRAGQGTDAPAHLQPVHVGQHQVQQHQIGHGFRRPCAQIGQAAVCVGLVRDINPGLAQILGHHLRQTGVVFDHQQAFNHGASLLRGCTGCLKLR